jgi:hypothetical protein
VGWLCQQLGVDRSVFYDWRQRQEAPGKRAAENARLTADIEALFQEHRGLYGSPRLHLGGRFGGVAGASADSLPQAGQLGRKGGELGAQLLDLLLLGQDQLFGTGRPRHPSRF